MIEQSAATIYQLLSQASIEMEKVGIENAKLDARLLLQAATGFSRTEIATNQNGAVEPEAAIKFKGFIEQRKLGKPVFRIIGRREFYGRDFRVFDDVLDPRPETELLVERVLEDWQDKASEFIEIGVGSGAISISLLAELSKASCIATDISKAAINAATFNAKALGVDGRFQLVETDCFKGVTGVFDFIVSNPPYITSAEMKLLAREVYEHDPHISLEAGENGLEFYARIFNQAHGYLKEGGKLYLETGHGQHADLIAMGNEKGWGLISKHLDLSGLERIVVFEETGLK